MAVTARMHRQRSVQLKTWKGRFPKQRAITRGTTTPSATVPVLTSISPTSGTAGTTYTITCTGSGYVSGQTRITIDGVERSTTFVSATSLTTSYRPSSAGTKAVLVHNGSKFSTTPRSFTVT